MSGLFHDLQVDMTQKPPENGKIFACTVRHPKYIVSVFRCSRAFTEKPVACIWNYCQVGIIWIVGWESERSVWVPYVELLISFLLTAAVRKRGKPKCCGHIWSDTSQYCHRLQSSGHAESASECRFILMSCFMIWPCFGTYHISGVDFFPTVWKMLIFFGCSLKAEIV